MIPADHPFRDFRNFCFYIWKLLNLPTPTEVQFDIAQYLQHGPKRRIIHLQGDRGGNGADTRFASMLSKPGPTIASKAKPPAMATFFNSMIT